MGRLARWRALGTMLLGGGVGCAQIAGIETTTGGVIETQTATLTLDKASIGASTITGPLDLAGLEATFLVPDETEEDGLRDIEAMRGEPGVWTAEYTDTIPYVMFTLPDEPEPYYRIFETGTADTRAVFGVLEHPNFVPPAQTDQLTVNVTLASPHTSNDTLQLFTVGPWGARTFVADAPTPDIGLTQLGPATFPYSQVGLFGLPPRSRIAAVDSVLVLSHTLGRLSAVLEAAPFDQAGDDTITGTMSATPATETLNVMLDNTTVGARFAPLRPGMPAPSLGWTLSAAPGASNALPVGPTLNQATVTVMPEMSNVSAGYANPFIAKGWPTVLSWRAHSQRSYMPVGAVAPAILAADLEQIIEPTAGATLDHPAGFPELITLADQPLSSDGVMFRKPTRAVTAMFVVPPQPANDLYTLTLYELVPNTMATALELRPVVHLTASRPAFVIPPEFFTEGGHYTLRAVSHAGSFPGAATGDFGTRSLPYASAAMDSGVFTVVAP